MLPQYVVSSFTIFMNHLDEQGEASARRIIAQFYTHFAKCCEK